MYVIKDTILKDIIRGLNLFEMEDSYVIFLLKMYWQGEKKIIWEVVINNYEIRDIL